MKKKMDWGKSSRKSETAQMAENKTKGERKGAQGAEHFVRLGLFPERKWTSNKQKQPNGSIC